MKHSLKNYFYQSCLSSQKHAISKNAMKITSKTIYSYYMLYNIEKKNMCTWNLQSPVPASEPLHQFPPCTTIAIALGYTEVSSKY